MVEYLRGAISYIQYIESMEFVTTRGARSLIHQGYRYTLNRRTAVGRYIGDVQTEVVLEEQSRMFMIC